MVNANFDLFPSLYWEIYIQKLKPYVTKNAHIDCDKDTHYVLNDSIVNPLDEEMKLLMNKAMVVFFMWNEDNKFIIKYSKEEDINNSFRDIRKKNEWFFSTLTVLSNIDLPVKII